MDNMSRLCDATIVGAPGGLGGWPWKAMTSARARWLRLRRRHYADPRDALLFSPWGPREVTPKREGLYRKTVPQNGDSEFIQVRVVRSSWGMQSNGSIRKAAGPTHLADCKSQLPFLEARASLLEDLSGASELRLSTSPYTSPCLLRDARCRVELDRGQRRSRFYIMTTL